MELKVYDETVKAFRKLNKHNYNDDIIWGTIFLKREAISEIKKYCKSAGIIREGKLVLFDTVGNLAHTGVKRVALRGVSDIPAISGIEDVKREDEQVTFLYSGEVKTLLSSLSNMEISDINISDPELDEIFMNYYVSKEGE